MIREYFEDVDRTWETFENTLWGHISNFFKLSKERYTPYFLVKFLIVAIWKVCLVLGATFDKALLMFSQSSYLYKLYI
jgi:hypothetical protein